MRSVERMPSVRFTRTSRFRRAYRKLDERYPELVKKALSQFLTDPTYPGLRVKRIQGTDRIWEMRAGRDIRITFQVHEGENGTRAVLLRNLGQHSPTPENP